MIDFDDKTITAGALKLDVQRGPLWPEASYVPIEQAVRAVAEQLSSAVGTATVRLSDDVEITALNRDFRSKDKPTNVLSFPDGTDGYLGDIILAYQTVHTEAAAAGKPVQHHVIHLVIHGLLHLLGYDHVLERDAARMEALEVKLLKQLNIPNPYEALEQGNSPL